MAKIGTAYQIYDDCIDLVGEETNTGKTLGTDLEKGKLTLPLLNLISSGTASQKEKLNQRILLKEPIDINVLAGIADYDGAIERALDTGKALLQESRELLSPLENTSYKTGLVEITNYLENFSLIARIKAIYELMNDSLQCIIDSSAEIDSLLRSRLLNHWPMFKLMPTQKLNLMPKFVIQFQLVRIT